MFTRDIETEMTLWRAKKARKPLIIRGARQVGKTTVVRKFSSKFGRYIYLNLELPADRKPFEEFSDFGTLINTIFFIKNQRQDDHHNTLIFIDEIQEVPDALQILRYFYEQTPELAVIAAGSMLESLFNPDISFPVGRVEYLVLQPVSFIEFLNALGEKTAVEQIQRLPSEPFAHESLLKLFRIYCLVGGMPEVVANYADNRDIVALAPIYESLLISYMADVEKYAKSGSQIEYLRHAIRASFAEAGKRIKFQSFGHSSYKSREMGEALRALEKALLIHLVFPQTSTVLPLLPDVGKSPRLHVLDTGMLNYFLGIQQEVLGTEDLSSVYHGTIIEHIVGQELLVRQYSALRNLNFWVRKKKTSVAEIDYLFVYKSKLIPIEVKSGKTGTMKSLSLFMDDVPHDMAVRFNSGKISITDMITGGGKKVRLLNLPYYLVSRIEYYLDWMNSVEENKVS